MSIGSRPLHRGCVQVNKGRTEKPKTPLDEGCMLQELCVAVDRMPVDSLMDLLTDVMHNEV